MNTQALWLLTYLGLMGIGATVFNKMFKVALGKGAWPFLIITSMILMYSEYIVTCHYVN